MKTWNSAEYAQKAMRTNPDLEVYMATKGIIDSGRRSLELLHAVLGIGTEIIELRDSDGSITNLTEELGDIMWYVMLLARATNCHIMVASPDAFSVSGRVTSITSNRAVTEVTKPTRLEERDSRSLRYMMSSVSERLLFVYGEMLDVVKRQMFYWPAESPMNQLVVGHNIGSDPVWSVSGRDITNKRGSTDYDVPTDAVRLDYLLAELVAYVGVAVLAMKVESFDVYPPKFDVGQLFKELTDANIAKLAARYPEKFSAELAELRDTKAEAVAINTAGAQTGRLPVAAHPATKITIVAADRPE